MITAPPGSAAADRRSLADRESLPDSFVIAYLTSRIRRRWPRGTAARRRAIALRRQRKLAALLGLDRDG